MPVLYSLPIRNARLAAVRDALNGGAIEILDAAGARIASMRLDQHCGDVIAGSLVLAGFPKMAMAERSGRATSARLTAVDGAEAVAGLTVGTADADIVLGSVDITAENVVKLDRAEIKT